jgi:hypothetical protein
MYNCEISTSLIRTDGIYIVLIVSFQKDSTNAKQSGKKGECETRRAEKGRFLTLMSLATKSPLPAVTPKMGQGQGRPTLRLPKPRESVFGLRTPLINKRGHDANCETHITPPFYELHQGFIDRPTGRRIQPQADGRSQDETWLQME